jgi:flagellar biosynthesis protein FlhG
MNSIHTAPERSPLTVAVGGGKGGVGKSVVALNLALSITKLGARVTLVDADLGSANLHTMLGIDRPGPTLQALLDGRVRELDEVLLPTDYENLLLVPGSVAVPGAANLHHGRKQRLLRQIEELPCDVVVLDCGAGIHYNTVDLFMAANMQLLVASPQLVSLQNAYGFLKASVYRCLRQRAQDLGKSDLVEMATDQTEVETVAKLLVAISDEDPILTKELAELLDSSSFAVLGNQLVDPKEYNAMLALSRMIRDFLCVDAPVLGALMRRERIHGAVTRRMPFAADGNYPEAKLLSAIAQQLLDTRALGGPPRWQANPLAELSMLSSAPPPPRARTSGIEYRGNTSMDSVIPLSRARSR